MIKKRIAAAAISVFIVATMAAIPALAVTILGYFGTGVFTYSENQPGKYCIQGAHPGWTSTSVKSSYSSYSGRYKRAYYYEYKNVDNTDQLLYADNWGGTGSVVTTNLGRDMNQFATKRRHYSTLYETTSSSSGVIDGVDTIVV